MPICRFSHLARAIDTEEKDFLGEIDLMKCIGCHKNIVSLIGASTQMKPLCLVLEYIPYGDLLHYLRKNRAHVGFQRIMFYCLGCYDKIFSYYLSLSYSTRSISKSHMINHIKWVSQSSCWKSQTKLSKIFYGVTELNFVWKLGQNPLLYLMFFSEA